MLQLLYGKTGVMAEDGAMELDSEENSTVHTGNVKKHIAIKLKTPTKTGRGPGRPRKGAKPKKEVVVQDRTDSVPEDLQPQPDRQAQQPDEELIEAPIFKQPVEPMHQNQHLLWNHKVNLIGEKVVDPLIHCCEKCSLPILIYGRMIPCKHVFCFDCARKTEKTCARCEEPVQRIEQSALGTVFICTHGGPKHGAGGCRRTYLSQRDLQAHVYHRHLRTDVPSSSSSKSTVSPSSNQTSSNQQPQTTIEKYSTSKVSTKVHSGSVIEQYTTAAGRHGVGDGHMGLPPPRSIPGDSVYQQQTLLTQMPPPVQALQSQPPMMQGPPPRLPLPQTQPPTQQNVTSQEGYQMSNMALMPPGRTNLITVPLQDDTDYRRRDLQQGGYMQAGGIPPVSYSTSMPPPGNLPPPQQGYPSTMAPALHQGPPPTSFTNPPPTGPPPFSSPPMGQQIPVSSSNPISHPPPGSVPAPNLATPPPPLHSGPRMPLQPPRFGSPQGHYDDSSHNYGQPPPGGQNQRAPWNGPPQRGPPPRPGGGPMHPPQSDYGQYYQ